MDESRKIDLENLMELYRTAPNEYKRYEIEGIIRKIMNETPEIHHYRVKMIDAIRKGDRRYVRYIQEKLRYLEKNQYGGRELKKL